MAGELFIKCICITPQKNSNKKYLNGVVIPNNTNINYGTNIYN